MLGPVTVVVDWVPSFNGSRELLAKEFDRVSEESDKTDATYVNVVQRDVSGYLKWWVSYPRDTPMLRKMVAGLNQLNFRDSILDVSLVVEGVIVRGFGSGERPDDSLSRESRPQHRLVLHANVPEAQTSIGVCPSQRLSAISSAQCCRQVPI